MVFTLCSVIPMMAERSVEVQAVLNILRNLYGHKIISSSMANVDWNCTEAENVFKFSNNRRNSYLCSDATDAFRVFFITFY